MFAALLSVGSLEGYYPIDVQNKSGVNDDLSRNILPPPPGFKLDKDPYAGVAAPVDGPEKSGKPWEEYAPKTTSKELVVEAVSNALKEARAECLTNVKMPDKMDIAALHAGTLTPMALTCSITKSGFVTFALAAFLPPILLLAAGLAFRWIRAGFRKEAR